MFPSKSEKAAHRSRPEIVAGSVQAARPDRRAAGQARCSFFSAPRLRASCMVGGSGQLGRREGTGAKGFVRSPERLEQFAPTARNGRGRTPGKSTTVITPHAVATSVCSERGLWRLQRVRERCGSRRLHERHDVCALVPVCESSGSDGQHAWRRCWRREGSCRLRHRSRLPDAISVFKRPWTGGDLSTPPRRSPADVPAGNGHMPVPKVDAARDSSSLSPTQELTNHAEELHQR